MAQPPNLRMGGNDWVYDPNTGKYEHASNPNDPMQRSQWAIGGAENAAAGLMGLTNPYAGISSTGDIESRFGLNRDVSRRFTPLRQNLRGIFGQNRGRALSSAATRMGSGTAIPEATFAGLEGELAGQENQALAALDAEQARAQGSRESEIAQMLYGVMGQGGNFDINKFTAAGGLYGNIAGGWQNNAVTKEELGGPDALDWVTMILGNAAKGAGAYLGA